MSVGKDTVVVANIYYRNDSTKTMRSHTHTIAIKQGTYVQLLALSSNLQDSFDKIIQRLLNAYNGHKKGLTSLVEYRDTQKGQTT